MKFFLKRKIGTNWRFEVQAKSRKVRKEKFRPMPFYDFTFSRTVPPTQAETTVKREWTTNNVKS